MLLIDSPQSTPCQLHHDFLKLKLSQLLLFIQFSLDVDSYKSFNTLPSENKEGADHNDGLMDGIEDGMTDVEGIEDEDSEGFKVKYLFVPESSTMDVITPVTTTINITMIRST